jgi:hypothetical protein
LVDFSAKNRKFMAQLSNRCRSWSRNGFIKIRFFFADEKQWNFSDRFGKIDYRKNLETLKTVKKGNSGTRRPVWINIQQLCTPGQTACGRLGVLINIVGERSRY